MALSPAVGKLVTSLGKAARGAHQARLDTRTLADLGRFATYLVKVEGKTAGTAKVYRSLAAKALANGVDSNNPMMMSALKALGRFAAGQ